MSCTDSSYLALHAFGLAVYFPYQHPKLHQWGM